MGYWFRHQEEWLTPEEAMIRPDRFVDELYVKGSADFEKDECVQGKVKQLVIDWENKDKENWALWKRVLSYSYLGQQLTLNRLGNKWDKVWHEHEHYQEGKDLVTLGLKKKIFKKGENGAIITDLNKFNIPDTVVIKADGTALYITQDLALTRLKKETFQPDVLHWVIGPEQSLALKQMFASCDKLGIIDYKSCVHIAYGYMSLKGKGKMSSRAGTVVYIDDLIDQVKEKIAVKISSEKFKLSEMDKIAEVLALGAIKYSILKVGRLTNTAFDLEESVSVDGNSGPYLQYTYARCCSVLQRSGITNYQLPIINYSPNSEELAILRFIYRFPEVVQAAATQYSPNLVCTFLYELAQRFNTFYNKHRILGSTDSSVPNSLAELDPAPQDPNPLVFRLLLTSTVSQVLKNGLTLLGIQTPEKM
jgi:arginyl-tRNA synthetase